MVNLVSNIRKRKKYSMYEILPLVDDDLRKFKTYYPWTSHTHAFVCFYYYKVVVIPCSPDGSTDWDGGGLLELEWSETDYSRIISELRAGHLINW